MEGGLEEVAEQRDGHGEKRKTKRKRRKMAFPYGWERKKTPYKVHTHIYSTLHLTLNCLVFYYVI